MSTFFWDEADTGFVAKLHAFWGAIANRMPAGIGLFTANNGDILDVATGKIQGAWTDGSGSSIFTSGTGPFAMGVGARVTWATSGLRGGRRVKGSTFIVPLTTACYANDGTLDAAVMTSIAGAASTLLSAAGGKMRVYSRPHVGSNDGQQNTVISSAVPDTVSWLRSRRT